MSKWVQANSINKKLDQNSRKKREREMKNVLVHFHMLLGDIYIEREGGGEKERESSTNITIWLDMIYIKR